MSKLFDSISKFSIEESSDIPLNDSKAVESTINIFEESKKKKENRKKSNINEDDELEAFTSDLEDEIGLAFPFDDVLDRLFDIDDDDELRNGLIEQGRKYNQSHSDEPSKSAYEKVFAKQETALNNLIGELDRDIAATEKDINNIRLARVRSPKALSDLISVKGSLYSTKLSAIKEITNIKKNIIDFNIKDKKNSDEDSQASVAASMALQSIISGDNAAALSTGSFREAAKGSLEFDESAENKLAEIEAEREFHANETEGDKYIKYENLGVQIYAQLDAEDRVVNLVAKDKDGNIVPDYPIPDVDYSQFNIHTDLGTVTDAFHRSFLIENI